MTEFNPNEIKQTSKPESETRTPIHIDDTWYDALLKKIPAGWKPSPQHFLYIGFGLLIFLGVIAASSTPRPEQQISTLPSSTPVPTLPPNIDQENPVSGKTFINTKYGFSFTHPGLSDQCCFIVGPTVGTAESVGNLSSPGTVRRGSTEAFDGFSLYVIALEGQNPNNLIQAEAENLKNQYQQQHGEQPRNASYQTLEVAGQPTILLKNYNSLTVNRYYIQFPDAKHILYIGASESRLGSFNTILAGILQSLTFDSASPSAQPSSQP